MDCPVKAPFPILRIEPTAVVFQASLLRSIQLYKTAGTHLGFLVYRRVKQKINTNNIYPWDRLTVWFSLSDWKRTTGGFDWSPFRRSTSCTHSHIEHLGNHFNRHVTWKSYSLCRRKSIMLVFIQAILLDFIGSYFHSCRAWMCHLFMCWQSHLFLFAFWRKITKTYKLCLDI